MNDSKRLSPRITHLAWGEMTISTLGKGKDFKLWPGGGRPWDWRETNTNHTPGIQPADVKELLEHGCRAVVLSRGMRQRLAVAEETVEILKQRQIQVHVAETHKAVEIYNELADKGVAVGGLFHSTC